MVELERPTAPVSIVCVNSTLPVRRAMARDGRASPLHHWGYAPGPDDIPLAHRLNRFEITLRARLGGLDLRVLTQTYRHLRRGASGVFLVTQPDLLAALPWLRRRFPQRRLVAWVWMDWEVDRHLARLAVCDHVLCLSPGAKRRLDECGLGTRASYVVWGCDPAHYRLATPPPVAHDVFVSGLTSRDRTLIHAALATGRYRALFAGASGHVLAPTVAERGASFSLVEIDREEALARAYHSCHASWIPLLPGDPYMPGFTNLVESLLCGAAVVLSDCTRIPPAHLALPGVFVHRTGNSADFLRATDAALAFARAPGNRDRIAHAAAEVFNGRELALVARRALGLPTPA